MRSFSGKHRITNFGLGPRIHISEFNKFPDLPKISSYIFKPTSNSWICYLSPSLLHVKRQLPSTGILTRCPSITPFGLTLGSDLPWAESPGPGTLRFSAGMILTFLIATHSSISSCGTSSAPYRYAFIGKHNALLPRSKLRP